MRKQIKTEYIFPPIPYRHMDWIAWFEGDEGEEQAPKGYGKTEKEAIKDLIEWEE